MQRKLSSPLREEDVLGQLRIFAFTFHEVRACVEVKRRVRRAFGVKSWDSSGTHVAYSQNKNPQFRGFLERMMGLEPTTFCMANASGRSRPFAPVRSNASIAGRFRESSERDRTRANAEPCHSCH
jgi:hypothetical protein